MGVQGEIILGSCRGGVSEFVHHHGPVEPGSAEQHRGVHASGVDAYREKCDDVAAKGYLGFRLTTP